RAAIVALKGPAATTSTAAAGCEEQAIARDDRSFKANHPSGPAAGATAGWTVSSAATLSGGVDPSLYIDSIAGNEEHCSTTDAIGEAAAVALPRTAAAQFGYVRDRGGGHAAGSTITSKATRAT